MTNHVTMESIFMNGGVGLSEAIATMTVTAAAATTSPVVDDEHANDYFDPRFPKSLLVCLLFLGLFGNSLCLFIFCRKNMRKNSTFIYLACLSVIDLFVLSLGLGDIILIAYFKINVRNLSPILCRLLSFLIYSFTHLSSFILASVSIDRAIATNLINFSKIYCKPNTAAKIIIFDITLTVFINFHNLLFLGYYDIIPSDEEKFANGGNLDYVNSHTNINNNNDNNTHHNELKIEYRCESKNGTAYDKFLDPTFRWIDLLAYAIIPFITMAICTILIVRVLFRSNRRLNKGRHATGSSTTTSDSKKSVNPAVAGNDKTTASSKPLLTNNANTNNTTRKPNAVTNATNNRANRAKHLTYTLIALNCLFFCLVSPLVIVLVFLKDNSTKKLLLNTVYLMAYINHAINFILYGFSSPPFRNELFTILGINKAKTRAPLAAKTQLNKS